TYFHDSVFNYTTHTVLMNRGSRSYAAPVTYAFEPSYPGVGNPADLIVAEVTGDQHLDVVVSLANLGNLATLPGNGDGSFGKAEYAIPTSAPSPALPFPLRLLAADFTGDGQTDVAVSSATSVGVAIYAYTAADVR